MQTCASVRPKFMAHTCSSLILMIKKERKIMYMERFQPATFYLIHYTYIYIISTLRLYNTCGLFIYYYFLLYVIKEITKKANNSIEFRTMQVDVRFFSRKYTYIPLLHDIKLATDPGQRHDPAIKIMTFWVYRVNDRRMHYTKL